MGSEAEKPVLKIWLVAVVFVTTALLIWMISLFFHTSFGLPTLALGGVLVLLAALLCFSTLMNVVGLSDKTQALGLPEGSVRAIIALALVGLFAILASSFLSMSTERKLTGLSQDQVTQFTTNNPTAKDILQFAEPVVSEKPATFSITYSQPVPADEFSKQMMTLIGTLMTAVVSFYFGAMPKTPSDASRAPPELSGIENGTRPVTTGSQSLVLSGSNLNSTKAVRVVSGTTELEGSNILSSGSQISATLAPNAAFAVPGSWDVTVVDDIGRTASKKAWLTFSAPATPPATPPEIKPIGVTPLTAPASVTDFTITGSGLDAVTKVEAVPTTGGGAAIQATGLTKAADKLTFKLALTTGPWSVRIAAGTAQPIAVPGTITVA